MKVVGRTLFLTLLCAVLALGAVPRLTSVEPGGGPPGAELVAIGQNLDAKTVVKLFLTTGTKDHRVKIEEQGAESIRFTIPAKVPPGQYRLMLQTGGASPALLEQPISCKVLAEGEQFEAEGEQELEVIDLQAEQEAEEAKKKKKKR